MKQSFTRIISLLFAFVILFSLIPTDSVFADYQSTPQGYWDKLLQSWTVNVNNAGSPLEGELSDIVASAFGGPACRVSPDSYHHADSIYLCSTGSDDYGNFANVKCKYCGNFFKYYSHDLRATYQLNKVPGNGYYTQPTTTTVDGSGNTTNYYRSGPTSNISLVNSGNKTFNSYQSTSYTTNNNTNYYKYQANIDLSNFLNTYNYNYVTNNYDIDYNYYTYNYTTNNYTFYLIDNSTTNYNYDVDVTYAPSYTQVTYISKSEEHNNVTNIYYYSLYDGRNSFYLTSSEIGGMNTGYDAVNYEQLRDDENLLSLQHFDCSYKDSSGYSRDVYSVNRSATYVDSGDFGQAVKLTQGSSAGIVIPELSSLTSLCVDFRIQRGTKLATSSSGSTYDWNTFTLCSGSTILFSYNGSHSNKFEGVTQNKVFQSKGILDSGVWYSIRYVRSEGYSYFFVNGDLLYTSDSPLSLSDTLYISVPDSPGITDNSTAVVYLDEFRATTGSFVSTNPYDSSTKPFDTNQVLTLPENPEEGKIYVRTSIPVTAVRVGGVRPSNPSKGFVYVPLDADHKGAGCQISDGVSWADVDGYIWDGGQWHDVVGYQFLTVGDIVPEDVLIPLPGSVAYDVYDDTDTLALFHFDGNLDDSSMYGCTLSAKKPGYFLSFPDSFGDSIQVPGLNSTYLSNICLPSEYYQDYDQLVFEFRFRSFNTGGRFDITAGGTNILIFSGASTVSFLNSPLDVSWSDICNKSWHDFRFVFDAVNNKSAFFLDGSCVGIVDAFPYFGFGFNILPTSIFYIDELRVSTGSHVSFDDYVPASDPFEVFDQHRYPDVYNDGSVYVDTDIEINRVIVGSKPSAPVIGDVWVSVDNSRVGQSSYIYDGSKWVDVDAQIYKDNTLQNVVGYQFEGGSSGSGSGGGSGGGSSGDKDSLWDKLGDLIGSALDGIFGIFESIVGALIDALIRLVDLIGDKAQVIVEMILGWFDVIPSLFSGFVGFLGAVFPFFPEEMMLLLTFGLAAVVFIGILKAVRR